MEFLATVEHALVVEYLVVCCALGHDLEAEDGGALTNEWRDAASAASTLALGEMFLLKNLSYALVDAGRLAQLGRASSISRDSLPEIPLGPPDAAQLEHVLGREQAIASAVDQHYLRLGPAVTSDPVFEGDLLDELRRIVVDDGPMHVSALASLQDSLQDPVPVEALRATRREAADSFEERLLRVSDRGYGLVLAALRDQFAPQAEGGSARAFALSGMEGLDEINRALVQRGLLPPFTLT